MCASRYGPIRVSVHTRLASYRYLTVGRIRLCRHFVLVSECEKIRRKRSASIYEVAVGSPDRIDIDNRLLSGPGDAGMCVEHILSGRSHWVLGAFDTWK